MDFNENVIFLRWESDPRQLFSRAIPLPSNEGSLFIQIMAFFVFSWIDLKGFVIDGRHGYNCG